MREFDEQVAKEKSARQAEVNQLNNDMEAQDMMSEYLDIKREDFEDESMMTGHLDINPYDRMESDVKAIEKSGSALLVRYKQLGIQMDARFEAIKQNYEEGYGRCQKAWKSLRKAKEAAVKEEALSQAQTARFAKECASRKKLMRHMKRRKEHEAARRYMSDYHHGDKSGWSSGSEGIKSEAFI
jgi:hypothetical protein